MQSEVGCVQVTTGKRQQYVVERKTTRARWLEGNIFTWLNSIAVFNIIESYLMDSSSSFICKYCKISLKTVSYLFWLVMGARS
jgi:hypothetical protein